MSTPENIESCRRCVRVIPNISPSHHSASGRGRPRLDMASHSRGAIASGSCADTLETRVQGMPDARCTRGLVCKVVQRMRTRAYRFSGGDPAFPAQWLYGLYRALPGVSGFLPPSPSGNWRVGPVGLSAPPQDLTPTAEASGPHDFAVRFGAVRPARRCPLTENHVAFV